MPAELKFYDLKAKKAFHTGTYKFVMKGKRRFAVATAPSGVPSYRIVSNK